MNEQAIYTKAKLNRRFPIKLRKENERKGNKEAELNHDQQIDGG